MELPKSKFNLGDEVFFIRDYKIRRAIIVGILSNYPAPKPDHIMYNLVVPTDDKNTSFTTNEQLMHEYLIFKTKEELKNSL